jgi:O-antigen biosynthesis protein
MTQERAKEIYDIFQRHGTDKSSLGYAPIYARIDPQSIRSVLEIGVFHGYSIASWLEIFPQADIWGIDISLTNVPPELKTNPRVSLIEKNVLNIDFSYIPEKWIQKFDLIVDDASHKVEEQLATWIKFFPMLRENGWYIIEDILNNENAAILMTAMKEYKPEDLQINLARYSRIILCRKE